MGMGMGMVMITARVMIGDTTIDKPAITSSSVFDGLCNLCTGGQHHSAYQQDCPGDHVAPFPCIKLRNSRLHEEILLCKAVQQLDTRFVVWYELMQNRVMGHSHIMTAKTPIHDLPIPQSHHYSNQTEVDVISRIQRHEYMRQCCHSHRNRDNRTSP